MDAPPLEPHELDALLTVLKHHDVSHYKDQRFAVSFMQAPEEEEGMSTDAIGFEASGSEPEDDNDIDDPEELDRQHSRAMGGPMPRLNPAGFKKG